MMNGLETNLPNNLCGAGMLVQLPPLPDTSHSPNAKDRSRSLSFDERNRDFIRELQFSKQQERIAAEEAAEKQRLLAESLQRLVLSGCALTGSAGNGRMTRLSSLQGTIGSRFFCFVKKLGFY
jgi:hypothetical protein